ncbi:MAG: MFS transporter [Sporolactobacillus sp.]
MTHLSKVFPFTNRHYLFLLMAQLISNLGDWLYLLALFALIAVRWQAQPIAMTGLMLCMILPSIFLGGIAGSFADRNIDRKKIMIVSDLIRSIIILMVLFCSQLWQVFLIIILENSVSSFFEPAKQGKLKEIVEDQDIQKAVSYSEIITNSSKIAGPMISGILVTTVGTNWSFGLNALSFLLSALLLTGLPKSRLQNSSQRDRPRLKLKAEFSRGYGVIRQSRILISGLIIFSIFLLVLQMADSQTVIMLRELPGQSINLLGICMTASGVGMFVSAVILSGRKIGKGLLTLLISPMVLGTSLILIATLIHLPLRIVTVLFPIIFLCCGFSFSMASIPFNVMAQQKTEKEDTGKVFGTINSVTNLATIIGVTIGGVLSEVFNVFVAFISAGIVLILVSLVSLFFKKSITGNEEKVAKGIERTHG